MPLPPDFYDRVYDVVRHIPPGRVTSYGAIAKALGETRASRVVGYAMNMAHNQPDVPAHRVVNRLGMLTGKHHFGGINAMEQLLNAEGIEVVDDQIQNFDQLFWNPMEELSR